MEFISPSKIESLIYYLRGQKVMLDTDLADLYGVDTSYLNKQVQRNIDRFPDDFMFRLSSDEISQFKIKRATRYLPYAFTENGVAMLSGVLRSPTAIQVNIAIMRIFTRMRSFLLIEQELRSDLTQMKADTSKMFKIVFERLDSIEESDAAKPSKKRIGLK